MWFTPSSTARRKIASAVSRLGRSPLGQPVSFIVPYPILATLSSPPSTHLPVVTINQPRCQRPGIPPRARVLRNDVLVGVHSCCSESAATTVPAATSKWHAEPLEAGNHFCVRGVRPRAGWLLIERAAGHVGCPAHGDMRHRAE